MQWLVRTNLNEIKCMVSKNMCYYTSSCCFVCGEVNACHIYSFKANFNYFSVFKIELVKLFSLLESYRQLHLRS